ncbi:neuropeptide CCHamide-1 [Drosophila obscura]|uniref:neuropeptide CCHamide-1 n=1 Tax=Drosophila obscura TaxID=7282 RepID=UPI001BB29E35|nr:neuropeptide CCHamide-1 [Drosophila obscura]
MWYMKCSWTLLVFVALFALVTGSCLEYGHSCWGAHGKRSGGKAAVAAAKTVGNPLAVETLAEQLYNNNHNNNNNPEDTDDDANTNNISLNNMPSRVAALPAQSGDNEERNRNHRSHEANDLKWTQLMRQQHRYQLRQQQQEQSRRSHAAGGRGGGQYDAAAESWRKLQQALIMAQAQAQVEAEAEGEDEAEQQQQQQTLSELYELKK